MHFKLLSVFLLLWMLCRGEVQPESECFNPRLRSYTSFGEFIKEATSKFNKADFTGQGDAADAAQAFVCVSAMLKWVRTFGTKSYTLDAYNWTDKTLRIFGQDVAPNHSASGEVYNGKGYFFLARGQQVLYDPILQEQQHHF